MEPFAQARDPAVPDVKILEMQLANYLLNRDRSSARARWQFEAMAREVEARLAALEAHKGIAPSPPRTDATVDGTCYVL